MRVLEGVTVIDFTQAYSGPFCTMQLADMGARVIKIERAKYGDQSRIWGPFADNGESGYFSAVNRGKEDITLDIGTEEGYEIARKLIEKADIVVENFKVGTLAKKGLGYEDVIKFNPEIIYASISGYGQYGPWNSLAAYDNVIQAQCGLMEMTGRADGVPTKIGVSVGDNYTGLNMAFAISMAYLNKLRTGKGQYIDVAMWDTLFGIQEVPILYKTFEDREIPRTCNHDAFVFPSDAYPCMDGYFTVSAKEGSMEEWQAFCKAVGMEELAEDSRFQDNAGRLAAYEELTEKIAPFFKERTCEELTKIFDEAGLPNSPVKTIEQLNDDAQLTARGMRNPVEDKAVGHHVAIGNPMKLEKSMPVIAPSAPLFGEHTESVLKELGYSEEQIADFKEREIV